MPTSASPEPSRDDAAAVAAPAEDYRRLRAEIGKVIIVQEDVVEELLNGPVRPRPRPGEPAQRAGGDGDGPQLRLVGRRPPRRAIIDPGRQ